MREEVKFKTGQTIRVGEYWTIQYEEEPPISGIVTRISLLMIEFNTRGDPNFMAVSITSLKDGLWSRDTTITKGSPQKPRAALYFTRD